MFSSGFRLHCMFCMVMFVVCSGCSSFGGPRKSYEQQVAEGRTLYELNGCTTCHGAEGRGDGAVTKAMHISPPDFRDAAAFVNGYDPAKIARTIATGVSEPNQSMPPYPHLSSDERELLAVFVMSLRDDSRKEERQ